MVDGEEEGSSEKENESYDEEKGEETTLTKRTTIPVIGFLLALNTTWLIWPRLKALSEVALFGTDVGTDIVNGYNLIEEGHTIWGTITCVLCTAMMFCAAFLGYYFVIPLGFVIIFVICNFLCFGPDTDLFITLFFTIIAPTLSSSSKSKERKLMKRTITITTSILLITLLIILIVPTIVDHKDLTSTYGLRHLNFQSLPGSNLSCAVCTKNETDIADSANQTDFATVTNITGQGNCSQKECEVSRMYLTWETFRTVWFPILFALGVYCLIDAILTQCKDKVKNRTRWPTAYRLAERIAKESSPYSDSDSD